MATPRGTSPLSTPPFADPPVRAVVGLLGVVALSAVDGTVVSTAMPRVVAALGGLDWYAWVFASFMLANTLATPAFGRFADSRGVRPCLAAALVIFLLGSAGCGASATMAQLIAWRAVQGAGVGGLVTVASAAFGLLYLPERRARAQSLVGMVWGVASLAGPLLGGLLVTVWPWPWIFWLNLPLGLAAVALARRDLPAALPHPAPGGAGPRFLPLHRNRGFVIAVIVGAGACATIYPLINDLPLYVQGVLGRGAPEAGAALAPMLVAWPLASVLVAAPMNRRGFRPLVVGGAALLALGCAALALPGVADAAWQMALPAVVAGAGMGMITATILVATQTSVPQHRVGAASAWLGVARNLGAAVGLAAFGELQREALHRALTGAVTRLPSGDVCLLDEPHREFARTGLPALADPAEIAFRAALGTSLREVFAGLAVVAVVTLLVALRMPAETPVEAARRGTQPL